MSAGSRILPDRDPTVPRWTRRKHAALFTFAALFGGVETFGLIGLLIGPLFMALAISTLRTFAAETTGRHAAGDART
jgi:hypothetical protein